MTSTQTRTNIVTITVVATTTLLVLFVDLSEARYMDSYAELSRLDFGGTLFDETPPPIHQIFDTSRGRREKRMLFDATCKGIYNREALEKLDAVCDACYNLYRKPYIATQCRRDCFNNAVLESCIHDLMLHDLKEEYTSLVRLLGK